MIVDPTAPSCVEQGSGEASLFRECEDATRKKHALNAMQLRVSYKETCSRACIGNPKPEQGTIKGTHAQEMSAYQRRPTTQHVRRKEAAPQSGRYTCG